MCQRSHTEGEQLLTAYLDQFASPDRRPGQLLPFDKGGVRAMVEQTNGRPGHLLQMAHGLIEHGARNEWVSVGAEQVLTFVRDHGEERRVASFTRKSGIGSID